MRKEYRFKPRTDFDPYERLANAVVLRAVKDYRYACKKLAKHPEKESALRRKKECETFFQSDHFSLFTALDGRQLLKKLREEVSEHDAG
jgi:hypothetical protein